MQSRRLPRSGEKPRPIQTLSSISARPISFLKFHQSAFQTVHAIDFGNGKCRDMGVMKRLSSIAGVLVLTISSAAYLRAADADPIIGVWKLNLAKSKYIPGPAPKSETRTYVQKGSEVFCTIDRVDSTGKHIAPIEFSEKYDGREYPVKGSAIGDALVLKRINDYLSEATMKHAGMVVATTRRIITDNGKTLMLIYKEDDREHPVDNIIVYDRVE